MKISNIFLSTITAALLFATTSSCKKDSNNTPPATTTHKIKLEITGTFTGKLDAVIADNDGLTETIEVTSLPWTKEKTYTGTAKAIGIGGNVNTVNAAQAGKTIITKIYDNGKEVKTASVTCKENGTASLPAIAYNF